MKKIIFYTFSLKLIIIILFIKGYVLNNNIENNVVMITKNTEIVKNSENPRGIFGENKNINKNISTGIFLEKNIVITSSHSVNTIDSEYYIYDNFGNIYNGKLIKKDTINDFAIIQTKQNFSKYKKININDKFKLGEEVFSIGYNEKNKNFETKKGVIMNSKKEKIGTNIAFIEGNSGGPIFNKNKELIGIILEVDIKNNLGYFLKISEIKK